MTSSSRLPTWRSIALFQIARHRACLEDVVRGIPAGFTGTIEAGRNLVAIAHVGCGKRRGMDLHAKCVVQGAGATGVIAVSVREEQSSNRTVRDAGPVDLMEDRFDIDPRSRRR